MRRYKSGQFDGTLVGILAALALIPSCGRDEKKSETLEAQVVGWWITPQTGSCYCPPQPECGAGDCVSYSVLGLLPDKRYFDGRVSVSTSGKTMSTMGALSAGTYRVEGGGTVVISQPNVQDATLAASVTDGKLKLGSRVDVRPPVTLNTALDQASAKGASWDRWPMQ